MIVEKTMYTVKCDGCGRESGQGEEICAWNEAGYAVEEAIDSFGWIDMKKWDVPGKPIEDLHYCPDCFTWDEEKNMPIAKTINLEPGD